MNKCIYIVVVMMCLLGCGASRETLKDVESLRMTERARLTELQGLRVVHGSTRMSEEMSVDELEVYYSRPDSSGRQTVTRTVRRTIKAERDAASDVQDVDSVAVKEQEEAEEVEASEEHRETYTNVGWSPWNVAGLLLVILAAIYLTKS